MKGRNHPAPRSSGEIAIKAFHHPVMHASTGLGLNSSAGRKLTSAEEGAVGSEGEDHGQRERLIAASAARTLEQGAPHRSETPVEAERCLDHTGPAPVGGAKTRPRVVQPRH